MLQGRRFKNSLSSTCAWICHDLFPVQDRDRYEEWVNIYLGGSTGKHDARYPLDLCYKKTLGYL